MATDTLKEGVLRLLAELCSVPKKKPKPRELDQEIAAIETRIDELPDEVREWLLALKATRYEVFGEILGAKEILGTLNLLEGWASKGWIPLAGDGCGNYYVLDTEYRDGLKPVYFIDHDKGLDKPACIMASGLWQFLHYFLNKAKENRRSAKYWIPEKTWFQKNDPALARYRGRIPYPWDVPKLGLCSV